MTYLDTSILVPFFVLEKASDNIRGWLATVPAEKLAISEWTRAEFASAVGISVRSGRLDTQDAQEIIQNFYHMADNSLTVLVPDRADFLLASRYMERFELGLRAGDALHLAIAWNHGANKMYSLDRALIKSAKVLNIEAELPI